MFLHRLVVLVALVASSSVCLAQHNRVRETGAPPSEVAPAQPNTSAPREASPAPSASRPDSSNSGGTSRTESSPRSEVAPAQPNTSAPREASPAPSASRPDASNPGGTSRTESSPRSAEMRSGQAPDRVPDRGAGAEDRAPHSQPEAPKKEKHAPPVADPNNQKPAEPQKSSREQNEQRKKLAEECRKDGGRFLYNGVCVSSLSEAQGYSNRQQQTEGITPCDESLRRARISASQSQVARACGPQGNATECNAAMQELDRALSMPGCR
jgi:hypothetical protein